MPVFTHIFIHHAASMDTDVADTHTYRRHHLGKGWQDIGYHFVVEKIDGDYLAVMGRPLTEAGAHCPGWNSKAVGVCLAGDFSKSPPAPSLLARAAQLVASLCKVLDITPENVHGHRDHRATECPGDAFDLAEFRDLVRVRLARAAA